VVSHHGQDISSLPMLVRQSIHEWRLWIMEPKRRRRWRHLKTLKKSPGLEDLWQLHYAVDAGEHNTPEQFIANQGTGGTAATGVPMREQWIISN